MAPTLYTVPGSPPVRAVLMTAKSIGLDLNQKQISLAKGEHRTPEYLKLNPQHTVPTLVEDDGFAIWDSHAIMAYLVSKYAKNDSLYPKDVKKRAIVDQRLHFEGGVVYAGFGQLMGSLLREGKKTVEQSYIDKALEVYGFVEAFLDGKQWIAGDSVTIADYSLVSTISTWNVVVKIDSDKFPKLAQWLQNVEGLPVYDVNQKGVDEFTKFVQPFLG